MKKKTVVFLIIAGLFLWGIGCAKKGESATESLVTPSNTKVIVHFSSQIDPRTATRTEMKTKSYSEICFFDSEGVMLDSYEKNDEVISDFIVEADDSVAYFFKNISYLSKADNVYSFIPDSGITVQSTQFGPKEVGYLDSLGLFYAYFNMGNLSDDSYCMVLRFLSENESYDVIIPYYAPTICFDEINQCFICEISSTDASGAPDYFRYVTVSYNQSSKKFELNDKLNSIPYSSTAYNDNYFLGAQILCSNDVVYRVAAIQSNQPQKMELILSKIDLDEERIEHSVIKNTYSANALGHPYLIGSADTPMSVHDNVLYVFTSDCSLITIDALGQITEVDFPYSFSGIRSRRSPYSLNILDESDVFLNTLISVEDNGLIYILTVKEDGIMQISQFLNNNYSVVWEGSLPKANRNGLMINSFEII